MAYGGQENYDSKSIEDIPEDTGVSKKIINENDGEDENVEDKDCTKNIKINKLEKSLELLKKMPHFSVFNEKQAFCWGESYLNLFIRENESDEWRFAGKVRHQLQMRQGVLIPIDNQLYLWSNQQCYVLGITKFLPVDLWIFSSRTHLSEYDEIQVSRWQWCEIEKEEFIDIYLSATRRSQLQTRVSDRGTRARNTESAINELNSNSWEDHLDMNELWTLDKEIRKCEKLLYESKTTSLPRIEPNSRSESEDLLPKTKAHVIRETEKSHVIQETEKNYVTAGILAILLGSFGAHKFYMGKFLKGFIYLVFFWTYIPLIISVIEDIQYLIGGQEKFSERLGKD